MKTAKEFRKNCEVFVDTIRKVNEVNQEMINSGNYVGIGNSEFALTTGTKIYELLKELLLSAETELRYAIEIEKDEESEENEDIVFLLLKDVFLDAEIKMRDENDGRIH